MNDGLAGQPAPHVGGTEAIYAAGATASYTVGAETTAWTPLPGERGQPLEVRFGLVSARVVLVRLSGRFTRGTDTQQMYVTVADAGTPLFPENGRSVDLTGALAGGGGMRTLSWYANTGSLYMYTYEAAFVLGPGPHRLQVWKAAQSGTSSATYGDRCLIAQVLRP